MCSVRRRLPLGVVLAVGACVPPPLAPSVMIVPGPGKDLAAFQQDDMICRGGAGTRTTAPFAMKSGPVVSPGEGIRDQSTVVGDKAGKDAGDVIVAHADPPDGIGPNDAGFLQCMTTRGDAVRPNSTG